MMRDYRHWRQLLLFFFDQNKPVTEAYEIIKKMYPGSVPSYAICEQCYSQFKTDPFGLQFTFHGYSKPFKDEDLKKCLDENPHVTNKEVAMVFNVDEETIRHRRENIGKHRTQRNPLGLASQIHSNTCFSLLTRHNTQKHFVDHFVTGSILSIPYNTHDQTKTKRSKENELKLFIWWDNKEVIYCKMLRSHESVIDEYSRQLIMVKEALKWKRMQIGKKRKVILLLEFFVQKDILKSMKKQILEFGWEVLPYPTSCLGITPSYYVFPHLVNVFKSKQCQNIEEFENWIIRSLDSLSPSWFINGFNSLVKNWKECLALEGIQM
ncbi:uncharacterized protein LOC109858047 [Pseudomyrmex gracilis]|uniref:uncharacterized protein LOC109858047 n=1 Tax=Pseudomyrmex gracilis TaxID=219809 RepID=UPI0009950137|nr:uncharacterized protein LOC109858047 [Pseudomyrmex gracilis]XP_020290511.1 uncharacterized protein LOC109858047 [Pseudomyrmex gracilis]XP_020290512.1 uncharacterized protein LOC109858047 [Pseudomyrmex gracilis]XP_020290513.1 uncharacterized protein LOC109858047 [Pseudomyrmex gracilis]